MEKNEKIHDAARRLANCERDLKIVREDKEGASNALYEAMFEEGLSIYQCDDVLVQIETKSKAKAKVTKALKTD